MFAKTLLCHSLAVPDLLACTRFVKIALKNPSNSLWDSDQGTLVESSTNKSYEI